MSRLGSVARLFCRISIHAAAMPWRRVSLERRLAMLPVANAPLTRQVFDLAKRKAGELAG